MEREFTRLRNLRPFDSMLRIDEANYLFKRGRLEAANALLARVLTQSAENDAEAGIIGSEIARQTVDLWDQYGSREMTKTAWSQIAAKAAPETREIVTRYLLADRRLDEAEAMIASLDGNARQALAARLQVARGDARGGAATAAAVLEQDDTHCDALVAQSEAQLALQRPQAAVRYGQRAAAECPDRPEAATAAAFAYTAFERPSGSDRLFRDAIDASPQNLRIASAYADWLLRQGRQRQAVATLRRYTRDTPSSVKGWRLYADLCRRTRSGCEREAELNRTRAASRYGIDLPPGQLQPNGLFGRLIER
jgi:predicted Zn-dependent protease